MNETFCAIGIAMSIIAAAGILRGGLEDHVKPYLDRIADALEKIAESRKA